MLKLMKPLFSGINGIHIASESHKQTGVKDKSLTYGEIQPQSFLLILSSVIAKPEGPDANAGVFVDLGCGTGLAVLCAALSAFPFSKCWGIEIVPELVEAARTCEARLQSCLSTCREEASVAPVNKQVVPSIAGQGGKQDRQDNVKAKAGSSTEDPLLTVVLDKIVAGHTSGISAVFDIEVVVAALIKLIGHKEYKKLLKGKYKTFKRFVVTYPDHFLLIDENTFTIATGLTEDDKLEGTTTENDSSDLVPLMEDVTIDNSANTMVETSQTENVPHSEQESHIENPEMDMVKILQHNPGGKNILNEGLPPLQLDAGDIFEIDWWSSAAVVYCASLLFSEDMMDRLSEKVRLMTPGSVFITLKPLNAEVLDNLSGSSVVLVSDSFYKMSWHMARVYIYRIQSTS